MKDFEKTIAFVRDFNGFCNLIPQLWHGLYIDNGGADHIIGKMRKYVKTTNLKGEELANEVKEVCPDVLHMQKYYGLWCSVLNQLDTFPLYDENFNDAVQWACKLDNDDKGCSIVGLISRMVTNYNDVMDGKRWLEKTYDLTPQAKEDEEIAEECDSIKETKQTIRQTRHKKGDFNALIQYKDKEKLLKRLHYLIDGKGGAYVGVVIRKAMDMKYITKPTKGDYVSEFELIGTWQAIHNYFNWEHGDTREIGILEKMEGICIF